MLLPLTDHKGEKPFLCVNNCAILPQTVLSTLVLIQSKCAIDDACTIGAPIVNNPKKKSIYKNEIKYILYYQFYTDLILHMRSQTGEKPFAFAINCAILPQIVLSPLVLIQSTTQRIHYTKIGPKRKQIDIYIYT